jgi:hypothetical protein
MKAKCEMRKNLRLDCFVPVEGKSGSAFAGVRTVDIGRGGVGLISNRPIPINEKIVVQLDLTAEGEPVLVLGQVKWVSKIKNSNNFRVGMTFCDEVAARSRSRLLKYLPEK